jgi:hypothetical protein
METHCGTGEKKCKKNECLIIEERGGELTKTACAPMANALKTSVPRRTPPSKRTGTFPPTASMNNLQSMIVCRYFKLVI